MIHAILHQEDGYSSQLKTACIYINFDIGDTNRLPPRYSMTSFNFKIIDFYSHLSTNLCTAYC